jgi:hypothetical protein
MDAAMPVAEGHGATRQTCSSGTIGHRLRACIPTRAMF